jgi:hypothetical protein
MHSKNLAVVAALAGMFVIASLAVLTQDTMANLGVGSSGEDTFPLGTEWTYNSKSGSLCSTTPDVQDVQCENVGEGRPCDEVRDEAGPNLTCATANSIPSVGPSGEDTFPPGTEWTYNSKSGSLCSTTPDGQDVQCENVGEGRPCDEVRGEADPNLTCNDRMTILP